MKGKSMDISLIFKVAGVGILVAVSAQILSKYGRDEQATFVGLAGIIVVLLMLVGELGELLSAVRDIFGL
jgi:stage III sporulation protein AC